MITIIIAIVITITAALVEARGYVLSFAAFSNGNVNIWQLGVSLLWYILGILIDYIALYTLSQSKIFIPELLSTIFMLSTIVGIALLSGQFFQWQLIDKIVAVLVAMGLVWLAYHVDN